MFSFNKILVSGVLWKFVYFLSNFLLNVIIANHLGAAESGTFFYILNNLTICILVLNLGFESAITHFNARNDIPEKFLIKLSALWSIGATVVFTFLYYLAIQSGITHYNNYLIVFYVSGSFLSMFASALYVSSNNNKTPNLIPLIGNIFLICFIIYGYKSYQIQSYSYFLPVYIWVTFLTGLMIFLLKGINRKNSTSQHADKTSKQLLEYSLKVFAANILLTLLLKSDLWLVKWFCSEQDLGNYTATTKLLQVVLFLPNLASFSLFPLISKSIADNNSIEKRLLWLSKIYFLIALAICIGFIGIGWLIVPLLYGSGFNKVYLTFLFYIPGILAFASSYPLTPFFSGSDKNKIITIASFQALVLMFIADVLLIPFFSIYGAAIGSSIAYSYYFIRLLLKFKIQYPFRFSILALGSPFNDLIGILKKLPAQHEN